MLPLWRDQLRIGLSPHAVILGKLSRGLSPRIGAKHIEPCQPEGKDNWQSALNTLARLLADTKWQHAHAHVTLSNHFARYLLIPWHAEIHGAQEQAAYVQHRFAKVFGSSAQNWTLRHSPASAHKPRLASAVDKALLEGIQQICTGSKLQLRSVQPYLMPAFNQHRNLFKSNNRWFVLVEREKLIIAQLYQQSWQHLSTHLINNVSLTQDLPQLLDRQLYLSGLAQHPDKVYVSAPAHPELGLSNMGKWIIHLLPPAAHPGLSLAENHQYALAMGEK